MKLDRQDYPIPLDDRPSRLRNYWAIEGAGQASELLFGCHNCRWWSRATDLCPFWPETGVSDRRAGCQAWACAYCGRPWWLATADHDICQLALVGEGMEEGNV